MKVKDTSRHGKQRHNDTEDAERGRNKEKSRASSTRTGLSFHAKTESLFSKARENAVILTKDIDVYADQIHSNIGKLFDLHSASQKNIHELMTHFKLLNESFESQLSIYPHCLEDVVSRRIAQSDVAYNTLQAQSVGNRKSRMKLMKNTKNRMDEGKERQSLAVDASALIKHYKSLLVVSK